jgi:PTS system mannitol-specific IIC component
VPMFLGAMVMGPLGGWSMKKLDALWAHKIRPGFEMLINNFSAGILGMFLAIFGYLAIGPVVTKFSELAGNAVDFLVSNNVLPLTSVLIEPAKVLFLNNAINHGVLTPLGTEQALTDGKSVLFLLEANPAAGLGLLLAYMVFGKGAAKASAPGAAIIHFFGGIHEIYFPYVLMKPKLIVAMIAGGMTQIFINVIFGSGLVAPAAPGSIFAVYAQTAKGSYVGVTLSVIGGAAVSFAVASLLLRFDKSDDEGDLSAATTSMESMKGRTSIASSSIVGGDPGTTATATRQIQSIVFACDAGMGSSAMGASVLRKKIHDAGHGEVTVVNKAIANLDDSYDLVVTHQDLTERARQKTPSAVHVSVDNFMGSPRYDEIVTMVDEGKHA